jgi:hypothetical protein
MRVMKLVSMAARVKSALLRSARATAALVLVVALYGAAGRGDAYASERAAVEPDTLEEMSDAALYNQLGINLSEPSLVQARRELAAQSTPDSAVEWPADPLAGYETRLPHPPPPKLQPVERALLIAYLNRPSDPRFAQLLAIYHLPKSLLKPVSKAKRGTALAHTILSLYFLNRARDLGVTVPWLLPTHERTELALRRVFDNGAAVTSAESHDAHKFYRTVFHLNRQRDRYIALGKLLRDLALEPRNVYTAFALTAINLWIGSEATYDDPTMLYNFVLGSYFSIHTIDLAHELELAWNRDPAHTTRFRMAAELGGFSLLQRRWLAIVHGDRNAVRLIDQEHREWYAIQPAFHAFTFGLPFFDEPRHFAEGYRAYAGGIGFCKAVPVRTCSDLPRFSFNLLSYVLGFVDFALKAGDRSTAYQLLRFRFSPEGAKNYPYWTLGRAAWEHREQNLDAILALYRNDNPADDPLNFEMKRKRWGENTTVCQVCHETQAKPQTKADVEAPQILPPPQVASINRWPAITTSWYGATKRPTRRPPALGVASR